jgi:hypothetical protein
VQHQQAGEESGQEDDEDAPYPWNQQQSKGDGKQHAAEQNTPDLNLWKER